MKKGGIYNMKKICIAIGILLLVVVMTTSTTVYSQQVTRPPIKIGLVYALTGPQTIPGTWVSNGVILAFEKRNFTIAGRKVEMILEDEEGKPDVALMKTKKLVEKDGVPIIIAPTSSASAYAIRDYLNTVKIPFMCTAAAGGLTRDKGRSPYLFRVNSLGGLYYGAQWAYDKMGCRKAIFAGIDYSYGREGGEAFIKGFKRAGGTIAGEIYFALGTKDFGPYVTKIGKLAEDTGADCLGITVSGADAVALITQIDEYGLKDKFRVMINFGATRVGDQLTKEDKAAVGHYEVDIYLYRRDNPENRKFLELVEKKWGAGFMDTGMAMGYLSGDVVARALEQVNGDVEDQARFLKAMRGLRFDSMAGPFEFDPRDQQMRTNNVIVRYEKIGGKMQQILVHEYPKTEDWWWSEEGK
jgi:branched-chain amino acid transport system substrate-binding protein